jgi:pimeloyl-ACP methyl ester carboxylesterase/DNA-binding CsgD family transcriptional regulator
MDAPPVRYTKTSDGVNVAWQSVGDGPALVSLPTIPFSHLEIEWSFPEYRAWYGALAKGRRLVRYDNRGSGLSQQAIVDFSLDGHMADLHAVWAASGAGECALFAGFTAGPVALAYAAHHPDNVTAVVLWCTWVRGPDMRIPRVSAVQDMLPQDWEIYTETLAHLLLGWSAGEPARRFAAYLRECVTQPVAHAIFHEYRELSAADLLPRVHCPVLVLHRRSVPFPAISLATDLVSELSDGRLTVLEGGSGAPYLGDMDEVVRAIDGFLAENEHAAYPDGLTEREIEVLRLIATGNSNRDIADRLVISTNTVARHISNIFAKTRVANRAEAASYANRHRLVPW